MTFLFDIGNVLLKLHFDRFQTTILGSPDSPFSPEFAKVKELYESGKIDDGQFPDQALPHLPRPVAREAFIKAWQDIFSLNDPMWQVVRSLKNEGHRLILFSNTNGLHAEAFLRDFPDFAHFDHQHFSHEVKALKPEPAFYQSAIEQYRLDPAETLYFDDLAENIATGRQFGFSCWQYHPDEHPAFLAWLAGQGIPLEPDAR